MWPDRLWKPFKVIQKLVQSWESFSFSELLPPPSVFFLLLIAALSLPCWCSNKQEGWISSVSGLRKSHFAWLTFIWRRSNGLGFVTVLSVSLGGKYLGKWNCLTSEVNDSETSIPVLIWLWHFCGIFRITSFFPLVFMNLNLSTCRKLEQNLKTKTSNQNSLHVKMLIKTRIKALFKAAVAQIYQNFHKTRKPLCKYLKSCGANFPLGCH